jgi:hypothetical protein
MLPSSTQFTLSRISSCGAHYVSTTLVTLRHRCRTSMPFGAFGDTQHKMERCCWKHKRDTLPTPSPDMTSCEDTRWLAMRRPTSLRYSVLRLRSEGMHNSTNHAYPSAPNHCGHQDRLSIRAVRSSLGNNAVPHKRTLQKPNAGHSTHRRRPTGGASMPAG